MANKARSVIQCDLDGNEIRYFASVAEACISLGYKGTSSLHRAIRYGSTAFGYRWKYEGTELNLRKEGTPGKRRKVVAIHLDSSTETTYASISEASRLTGIGISAIENALQTGGRAKGYRFRYEGEAMVTPSKTKSFRREVVAIDDNNQIIKTYQSVYDVAKELGVIPSAIYWCLSPKHPNAKSKGYRFRYKDEWSKQKGQPS